MLACSIRRVGGAGASVTSGAGSGISRAGIARASPQQSSADRAWSAGSPAAGSLQRAAARVGGDGSNQFNTAARWRETWR